MAGDGPTSHTDPRPDRGQLAWSILLNGILIAAFVLGAIPVVAIARGFVEMLADSKARSGADWLGYGFAFTGLFLGAIFFAYAMKYYLSTVMVLLTTLVLGGSHNSNGHGSKGSSNLTGHSRINGDGDVYQIDLGYHPFVSVHVAAYNEKRVIERLLQALDQLEYPEYEVILVDDSNDESVQILQRWRDRPRFKILQRTSRKGYKGGALQEALKVTDPRAEYVVVFDADSVPFPDSIDRLLPHFYRVSEGSVNPTLESAFGRAEPPSEPGQIKRRKEVAAVQSYQWHVLNKSESWLTEAVRAEYSGSYMVERPFQDAVGALKMIAGTAYMIRADVLREVGWGTSITEDWELTLKLYARGYKVAYTPWAETPAECVSTFTRLARQRMRWAEGHTHNVRKWFLPIMRSPFLTPLEKGEFLFDSTYYLQAGLFVLGTLSWLLSETVFHTHVPGWTAALGWSLLFSNIFALPLMNVGGLILEEAPRRDMQGVLGALVLSFALVPFQGWAAFKGLVSKDEGPWFRTPKTGKITDEVRHLRRLQMLRRWLLGRRSRRLGVTPIVRSPSPKVARPPARPRGRELGWVVIAAMVLAMGGIVLGALRAPVGEANGGSTFELFGNAPLGGPTVFSTSGSNNTTVFQEFGPLFIPACPAVWTAGVGPYPGTPTPTTAAQTVYAGTYQWQYWSLPQVAGVGADGFVNWTFEYGDNAGCATNTVTIAAFTAVPLLMNQTGFNAVVGTSSTNVNVPANKYLCLSITWNSGGPVALSYGNHGVERTNFTTPQVIFVPEFGPALLGLALAIPVATKFWTGRRRGAKESA
jgi:cellulose synthase/poly-beta-1,6-N-acetylglucosamine synthase-like glycosyltransferase